MPIPTDTYWNVKRLNWLFAISAVLLVAVTGWSIIQDYNKEWRAPQRNARVWEAAITTDKIDRQSTPEKMARLQELDELIARQERTITEGDEAYRRISSDIRELESAKSDLEFRLNSVKAEVTVMETHLQDAIAAENEQRVRELTAALEGPRAMVEEQSETLAQLNEQLAERRDELSERTRALDELKKERARLAGDRDLLQKKLDTLRPNSLPAKLSAQLRAAPLMQFINPSERVQQVVLPDVQTDLGGFKRVETIDRCQTCHVNIGNKDFTEPKVLAYLEEQIATARRLVLPETFSGRAADAAATIAAPGPAAMPEFWHAWARELFPAAVARNRIRTTAVANTVGKLTAVTVDGEKLEKFAYDPAAATAQDDAILVQLIRAISAYERPDDGNPVVWTQPESGGQPAIRVEIAADVDEKALATVRNTALRYVEELAKALRSGLEEREQNLLQDRYRFAMVDEVNIARRKDGYAPLDASPVYLAHPDLSLYVDVDSKHPLEAVGCTSCHDGSGLETDFVLAAHVPRPIWVDNKTGVPVLPAQLRPKKPIATHTGPDLSDMLETMYPEDAIVPEPVSSLQMVLDHHGQPHLETSPTTQPTTASSAGAHAAGEQELLVPDEAPVDAAPTPYVDPVTGREGRAVAQLTHWKKYEAASGTTFKDVNHYWDRPMLPPMYMQANCVRCHTDAADIRQHAPVVNEGRMLFKNLGCVNCHQMDSIGPEVIPTNPDRPTSDERLLIANGQRKVGTDLRHVTSKLSPAMINTWIWSPKSFRPTTKMPHFFMLENNSSDEELRRTQQEARAITEYLVRTATPLPPKHLINPALKGSAEGGKIVFNNIGCLGCHSNLNDTTAEKRGNKLVTLGEKWIVNDLVKNGKLARELEARLGKVPDTKTLTAEAQKLYDGMTYNERQIYALENLGERGEMTTAPRYPDNSPKPIFIHHGPELSGIGTKLTAGRSPEEARQWLFDWLKEPRHYSEYTVMPQLRLNDQQAIDLVEYLLAQKRTKEHPDDPWSAGLSDVDSPKLIEMTSMFLRSRFSAKKALEKADEDAELTLLATDALKPVDADDKQAVVKTEEQVKALTKDQKRLVFLGKKLISHYGCMSCHAINGAENMTSPCANLSDWGQKGLDKLDFGFLDHHKVAGLPETSELEMVNGVSAQAAALAHKPLEGNTAHTIEVGWPHLNHTRTDWITQKLKNSRIYDRGKALLEPDPQRDSPGKPYDKLKMPTFYLTEQEVNSIVTFVISNRDRLVSERLQNRTTDEQAKQIALGRQIAEKYNCVNCHQIEGNVPAVQQYYKADEMTTEAPPSLRGEGNKIQHDWLFNFLKNVEPLRPLLHSDTLGGGGNRKVDIRMPSFPIEDAEAAALAAYFAAASNKESEDLETVIEPVLAYVAEEMEASDEPLYLESAWPGDDWYLRPEFSIAAERLAEWGLQNGQINALQLDRTKYGPAEMARNMRQLLFKARFTTRLYDAPYPFVDSPRPTLTPERFKRGESLFYEMQCLKCHVLGDPSVAGANKTPTAPNLSLTYRRLQPRWVRHWVQEPPIIQTGTAMPPFLTGIAVDSQIGQTWPKSQGAQEAEVRRVESLYGNTPEAQADLLLEFLYAAGVSGYTGVQPAQPGALPGVEPIVPPTPSAPTTQPIAATPPATQPAGAQTAQGQAATTQAATPSPQAATKPATTQPVFVHVDYGKLILPGKRPEAPKAAPPDTAVAAKPAAPAVAGVKLTGKVLYAGKPPEPPVINMSAVPECDATHANPVHEPVITVSDKGELRDVIVWVDGVEGNFPTRTDPAVLDQEGCMYVPHVLAVQVGQPLVIKNSDPFLHNVHAMSTQNPSFNFGQPNIDPGKQVGPLRTPELFRVKCDVHPWMSAQIRAFEHPFFATTPADGSFAIADLPPGSYTVRAWHEKLGEITAPLTVTAGKPATLELKFDAASADAGKVMSSEVVKVIRTTMAGAAATANNSATCPSCTGR